MGNIFVVAVAGCSLFMSAAVLIGCWALYRGLRALAAAVVALGEPVAPPPPIRRPPPRPGGLTQVIPGPLRLNPGDHATTVLPTYTQKRPR